MMDKKRREYANCELLDLTALNQDLIASIAQCVDRQSNFSRYELKKQFGKGHIELFEFEGLLLQRSTLELQRDLVCYYKEQQPAIGMSFLLEGQKIVSLKGAADLLHESQESYALMVPSFEGYVRIRGGQVYREYRIRVPLSYLQQHGHTRLSSCKTLKDSHLVHPIAPDTLALLMRLDMQRLIGPMGCMYGESKILELLSLELQGYEDGWGVLEKRGQQQLLKKLYTARQLLLDHLDKNLGIREISREVGLNEYQLKKEFKRIFGDSIHLYYTKEKMKKAKNLLKATQRPIYDIAGEIGYKNATHFSAAFKRYVGSSPKAYRAQL